jgi:hypothetical protein
MRAHSLALSVAAVVSAFALFATPAEAGGKRYKYYDGYYNGGYYRGGGYGYYRPYYRNYYRPARYYRPVYYAPPPVFYGPAFSIGFSWGGGGYRHCR